MSKKQVVVVAIIVGILTFVFAYMATHIVVTAVMADFKVEPEPYYGTLKVEDNYGLQTDNHYDPQKTAPLTLEDVNGYTVVKDLEVR